MLHISKGLITLNILYYIPDYTNILQEFLWQTEDVIPEYPKVIHFLDHWQKNINAVVKEVQIAGIAAAHKRRFRSVDMMLKLN